MGVVDYNYVDIYINDFPLHTQFTSARHGTRVLCVSHQLQHLRCVASNKLGAKRYQISMLS